ASRQSQSTSTHGSTSRAPMFVFVRKCRWNSTGRMVSSCHSGMRGPFSLGGIGSTGRPRSWYLCAHSCAVVIPVFFPRVAPVQRGAGEAACLPRSGAGLERVLVVVFLVIRRRWSSLALGLLLGLVGLEGHDLVADALAALAVLDT